MPRLSASQKLARLSGIGSSDLAELLGISPYEGASPVRLFAEKVGILPDEDSEETIEQRVGHALEGALVKLYESESGFRVLVAGEYVETVKHPEVSWRQCNLDGRIEGKRAALEIKVVGIGMAGDWDLLADDGIPPYVRVQVAWQMHVADLDEIHVCALIGGTQFRVFYIRRDLELEAIIVEASNRFWIEHVALARCPPLDASPGARAYLDAKYPAPAADVEIEAPADVIPIGIRRLRAEDARKLAEEAKDIASAQLVEALGVAGATVMWCEAWRASYRPDKNGNRSLRIVSRGEPRARKPKANAARPPELVTPDGEAF